MGHIIGFFRAIWFWHYERGTWQYDVMCVAILAFIFFIPTSFFDERKPRATKSPAASSTGAVPNLNSKPVLITADDIKNVPPADTLQKSLESAGLRNLGRPVTVRHFEVLTDSRSGTIVGYRVWFD
ncbi:MAG: hypothetical protein K1Y36_14250 [Blastocatellia bacterium]|nr:hypothetical protein [Blastocatellia bacterium]